MNLFELFFLDLGFSWQNSRLIPFIIIISGSLTILWLLRKYAFEKRWLKISMKIGILVFPVALYFLVYPVYRGDLCDLSRKLTLKEDASSSNKSLKIYVLPNCPYCIETIEIMNQFHQRNPKIEIEYVIISGSGGGSIAKELPEFVKITYRNNSESIKKITMGSYPCFVLTKDNSLSIWDNNSFGLKSLDIIESAFSI
jgi:thiol-disulfide isomerase/thioredoxin